MKSQVVIDINHHIAVNVQERLVPVFKAVMEQAYATYSYEITVTKEES